MSGVCGTRTEEVQLKAAGNGSELCEIVGVPVREKECLQNMGVCVKMCVVIRVCAHGVLAPRLCVGFGCCFDYSVFLSQELLPLSQSPAKARQMCGHTHRRTLPHMIKHTHTQHVMPPPCNYDCLLTIGINSLDV